MNVNGASSNSSSTAGKIPRQVKVLLTASFFSAFAAVGQITIIGKQVFDMTGKE